MTESQLRCLLAQAADVPAPPDPWPDIRRRGHSPGPGQGGRHAAAPGCHGQPGSSPCPANSRGPRRSATRASPRNTAAPAPPAGRMAASPARGGQQARRPPPRSDPRPDRAPRRAVPGQPAGASGARIPQPGPRHPQPGQRRLHQVFSQPGIPCQQHPGAQQRRIAHLHQLPDLAVAPHISSHYIGDRPSRSGSVPAEVFRSSMAPADPGRRIDCWRLRSSAIRKA